MSIAAYFMSRHDPAFFWSDYLEGKRYFPIFATSILDTRQDTRKIRGVYAARMATRPKKTVLLRYPNYLRGRK